MQELLDLVVNAMIKVGEYDGLDGKQKKELVMKILSYELEIPSNLSQLVDILIDLLIQVEKGEIKFNSSTRANVRRSRTCEFLWW